MNSRPTIDLSERKIILRLLDVAYSIGFMVVMRMVFGLDHMPNLGPKVLVWLLTYVTYLWFFGYIFELYNLKVASNFFATTRSIFLTALIVSVLYTFTPRITPFLPDNRIEIIALFCSIFFGMLLWRLMYIFLFKSTRFNKNIIYIGADENLNLLLNITASSEVKYNVLGRLGSKIEFQNSIGVPKIDLKEHSLSDFIEKRGVEEIIICKDSYSNTMETQFNAELAHLFEQGVNIQSMAEFYMEMTDCIPKRYLDSNFYEHLTFSSSHSNRFYIYFMRILDVLGSLIGLTFFMALLPLILLGNLFGNRGRIFYTQTRTGKHEKPFKIFKLRTMVANAEEHGAQYASVGDTRITIFGRFLRNSRLDEVPQLINVLKGDMKLIGPRPERPEFIEELAKEIPFYKLRHIVPPGLTGWAQVMYPYANSVEEQERKLRYDLYYLKNRNFYMDFQIVMKTVGTVLFYRGQ